MNENFLVSRPSFIVPLCFLYFNFMSDSSNPLNPISKINESESDLSKLISNLSLNVKTENNLEARNIFIANNQVSSVNLNMATENFEMKDLDLGPTFDGNSRDSVSR